MIFYEFPTSERIRTLLRLESAFSTLAHFIGQDTSDDHHAAIMMLFDLAEIGARGDIKSEFLQELERQRVRLEGLRDNPAIAEDTLENTLDNIEHIHDQQLELTSRFGNEIRESEWLSSIRQRTTLVGGAGQFDIPAYAYWQKQPTEVRRQDLLGYQAPLLGMRDMVAVLLKLLRENGRPVSLLAKKGKFQQMSGGHVAQLVRIGLSPELAVVPEVSSNRHMVNVRFLRPPTQHDRGIQAEMDVHFHLASCKF